MPIVNTPPPVRTGSQAKTPAARIPRKNITEQREEALNGFGQLAQAPLIALRQYADAGAIGLHWPGVSHEVAALAETQDQVARLVDPLIRIGPFTGLIAAILPMILQIGVNHGRVPAGAMGTIPAASLTARVEATLAAVELEALQAQAEAEKQAALMRTQIAQTRKEYANANTQGSGE